VAAAAVFAPEAVVDAPTSATVGVLVLDAGPAGAENSFPRSCIPPAGPKWKMVLKPRRRHHALNMWKFCRTCQGTYKSTNSTGSFLRNERRTVTRLNIGGHCLVVDSYPTLVHQAWLIYTSFINQRLSLYHSAQRKLLIRCRLTCQHTDDWQVSCDLLLLQTLNYDNDQLASRMVNESHQKRMANVTSTERQSLQDLMLSHN